MEHLLRCRCGIVRGRVDTRRRAGHARCYCKDCQAYARFLGRADKILDSQGGTEIVACLPQSVRFGKGGDRLACMSLGDTGLLRWYAACCRTPIGNTLRDPKIAFVGLVRACLPGSDAAMTASFGPLNMALYAGSARGKVAKMPVTTLVGMVRIMSNVIGARLTGQYRQNPFFDPDSGVPVAAPYALTTDERAALDATN